MLWLLLRSSQGLVITQLRQAALRAEVEHRRNLEALRSDVRARDARVASLEHSLRTSRDAGTTRVRELESGLRIVKGRGDARGLLAAARAELASER